MSPADAGARESWRLARRVDDLTESAIFAITAKADELAGQGADMLRLDAALAAAHASAARWSRGEPMSSVDGVPCAIKDLAEVKGMPALFSSIGPLTPSARDAAAMLNVVGR